MDLKFWLRQQCLSVRELAAGLGLPLKTVQDWVYRGVMPSPANRVSLEDFHAPVVCTPLGHRRPQWPRQSRCVQAVPRST